MQKKRKTPEQRTGAEACVSKPVPAHAPKKAGTGTCVPVPAAAEPRGSVELADREDIGGTASPTGAGACVPMPGGGCFPMMRNFCVPAAARSRPERAERGSECGSLPGERGKPAASLASALSRCARRPATVPRPGFIGCAMRHCPGILVWSTGNDASLHLAHAQL